VAREVPPTERRPLTRALAGVAAELAYVAALAGLALIIAVAAELLH
jgi:hypothetical protein